MRIQWSRRKAWLATAAAALCALTLLLLVVTAAIETEKGVFAAAFLFIVGVLATISTLFATEGIPVNARHWTAWLQPRPIGVVFIAIFAAFGTMTNTLALFSPRPAVETKAFAIEDGVNRVENKLDQLTSPAPGAVPARVRQAISGVWGEPGCLVTYRFAAEGDALVINSERRPTGTNTWRSELTILTASGDELQARTEQSERPGEARGQSVTFTYRTNGVTERLLWHKRSRPVPLELDRCPAEGAS